MVPSGEMSKDSGILAAVVGAHQLVRRQIDHADAVGGAIGRRQLGLVDARAGNRRTGQRDQDLLAVAREPDAARPLPDRNPLDDGARFGIDDDDVAAGLVGDVEARTGRIGRPGRGRRGRRRRRRALGGRLAIAAGDSSEQAVTKAARKLGCVSTVSQRHDISKRPYLSFLTGGGAGTASKQMRKSLRASIFL